MLTLLATDIENYKSFRGKHRIVLDMAPGLIYVAGKNKLEPRLGSNGAGKTTIFDAVYWCWTGDLLSANKPAGAVVPWTGSTSKRTRVKNWFDKDGVTYGVTRQRGPNGLWLQTGRDGTSVAVDQSVITQLIGLSNEAIKRTLILGQFTPLFLDLEASKQSALFNEVLPLGIWIKAADMATRQLSDAKRNEAGVQAALNANQGRHTSLVEQLVDTQEAIVEWKEQQDAKLQDARTTLRDREKELIEDKRALAEAPKPTALDKEIDDLGKQLVLDRRFLSTRTAAHNTTLNSIEATKVEINRLTRQITELEEVAANKHPTCPECGQEVEPEHVEGRLAELVKELATTRAVNKSLLKSSGEEAEAIKTAEAAIAKHDASIAPKLRKAREAAAAYSGLEANVRTSTANVASAKLRMAEMGATQNPHVLTERRQKEQLAAAAEGVKRSEADLEAEQAKIEALALAGTYYKEIRLGIIDEVLMELEVTSNQYAEELGLTGWKISFATERETQAGTTVIGLTTMVVPPDGGEPVRWELFSGGQRQRLQLAVTFGLSEVLLARAGLDSNVEVLDEPTKGMSEEGITDLLDHLSNRARLHGKTIFVIEHHALDKGAFDDVLLVTLDETGSNAVLQ